ncbi:hypothetical protein P168DRAFT_13382 [Aspergillus campestris IBT 28561]|uniref:Basic proline-rich protein n=1 Tax=Aspergillus campestris (strain IBT 28561) TaxID=1392248 RepID=A0A2I1DEJ9_ASPC2|nr:uncharacterized protein P168DRAFT_13382 [Aspergillus campestris IBT 28561]PKY08307.1 hypothetical protein P168DRAFT_13382 [Aspergillus campestris IBT 28561]
MELFNPPPERIMLPPSPTDSIESVSSVASDPPGGKAGDTTDRPEDVMITLSLSPNRPANPPSRLPFTRTHFRSRSLAGVPSVPPMTRAHSSPGLDSRGRYIFVTGRGASENALDSSTKRHFPLQTTPEEYPHHEARTIPLNISETISEHGELDITMSGNSTQGESPTTTPLPRLGRRRPSSPLHFYPSTGQFSGSPSSGYPSPIILNSRYNESFPGYSTSSASSMPSTPTSLRSRSPSISSLETIPDIPDAEAEADEADHIAALKLAADTEDESDATGNGNRRRGTSDLSGPSNSFSGLRAGSGGYGVRGDKRKRWSVCGAERRQDLDLETIWED